MRLTQLLLVIIVVPVVLTGCFRSYETALQGLDTAEGVLNQYDQKVIEKNQQIANMAQDKVGDAVDEGKQKLSEYTRAKIDEILASMTDQIENEIDAWLAEQGLNEYGDPQDTMYIGGTPLFNEQTGETKDRYEYILEQNPELVEELTTE